MPKVNFLTYGSEKYFSSLKRLRQEFNNFKTKFNEINDYYRLDKINTYKPEDLEDYSEDIKKILKEKPGAGYFIWKGLIISQKLRRLRENDFLIYIDSGSTINTTEKSTDCLKKYLELLDNSSEKYGIISFCMKNKPEKNFTTEQVFDYFDIENGSNIRESNQNMASILIIKKNKHSQLIFDEYFKVCETDPYLFTDNYNEDSIQFRHDQSILSVIRKKYGSIILEDETYFEPFGNKESLAYPFWVTRKRGNYIDIKNIPIITEKVVPINKENSITILDLNHPQQQETLPNVSIVTITKNRKYLFDIPINNWRKFLYPKEKLEWVIIDDSDNGDTLDNILPRDRRINYIKKSGFSDIADKRNFSVEMCKYDYIVHMDDDDFYFPDSVYYKVLTLLQYKNEDINCVFSLPLGLYNLIRNSSQIFELDMIKEKEFELPEAVIAYTKEFWKKQKFGHNRIQIANNRTYTTGESFEFLKGRVKNLIKIPFLYNCIAVTHNLNFTGNKRFCYKYENDKINFIDKFDENTRNLFHKIRSSILEDNYKIVDFQKTPILSTVLLGGLGNQLFQIATILNYSFQNEGKVSCVFGHFDVTKVLLDAWAEHQDIEPWGGHIIPHPIEGIKYIDDVFPKLNWDNKNNFDSLYVNDSLMKICQTTGKYISINSEHFPTRLLGYFFNSRYWHPSRDKLLDIFTPCERILKYIDRKYKNIFQKTTISIHFRLGHSTDNIEICKNNLDFYIKTFNYFEDEIDHIYLIFTDNIEKFEKDCSIIFKNKNYKIIDENVYISLRMMSMCNHNVLHNSTLSFWGAYLNPRQPNNKTILHHNFFINHPRQMIPKGFNWTVIKN